MSIVGYLTATSVGTISVDILNFGSIGIIFSAFLPMLISANIEAGGSGVSTEGTRLGCEMAVAATGKPEYAKALGEICAYRLLQITKHTKTTTL